MDGVEETPILYCVLKKTLIFISKFNMEACLQMSYALVVQRKEGHILLYHVPERPKKIYLKQISKFKFQYRLKQKTNFCFPFLR